MQQQHEVETSADSAESYSKIVKSAVDYSSAHYGDIAKGMSKADRAIRAFVADRPFAAAGLALAMGYLVARSINGIR